jgi:hypothetical protein
MHPSDAKLAEVARRYASVGMQAARAFNEEQATLGLDLVLGHSRLSSDTGTQTSLLALQRLRELTAAHKEAYSRVVLAAASEFTAVLADLPIDVRQERENGIVASINWQLAAQSAFYANRERWADAAEGLCRLIDAERAGCTFTEDAVNFACDSHLERFEALLEVIEQTHQIEVATAQERLTRFAQAAASIWLPG